MAKDTPSIAKNKMRRSLVAIYDPPPTKSDINKLWQYFQSNCAYCGAYIERESRTGHLDHLVSASEGGSNNIHNHALSCARCNGDEKREESWESFLASKAGDEEVHSERKAKIKNWLTLYPKDVLTTALAQEAENIINDAIKSFEASVEKMRGFRDKNT